MTSPVSRDAKATNEGWQLSPGQHPHSFEKEIRKIVSSQFLLFLPEMYNDNDKNKKWPLIIFLHGSGESGDDLEKLKDHGPPQLVENKKDFPFIVVSPQARLTIDGFDLDVLNTLLDEVLLQLPIDTDRIYLTGLSRGAFTCWRWAAQRPEQFAAIAPVCGWGDPRRASNLKNMPIWAFHGAQDDVVKIQESQVMVDAIRACGGNISFTIYPDAKHDAWTETYANPELYAWLLRHKKRPSVAST